MAEPGRAAEPGLGALHDPRARATHPPLPTATAQEAGEVSAPWASHSPRLPGLQSTFIIILLLLLLSLFPGAFPAGAEPPGACDAHELSAIWAPAAAQPRAPRYGGEFCTTCGEKGADKRCSVCKMVMYCDQNCQKTHWFTHKKVCKTLKEIHDKQELEAAKEKRRQEKKQKKDEAQLEEAGATSEEQSAPGPDATKEADPNLWIQTDQTEETELTKEPEARAPHPDSPLESETALADIALQKIQDSEE